MPKKDKSSGSEAKEKGKGSGDKKASASATPVTAYQYGTVRERAAMKNQDHRGWNYLVLAISAIVFFAPFFHPESRERVVNMMTTLESHKFCYGWFSTLDFCGSCIVCFAYRTATEKAIAAGDETTCRHHSSPLGHYAFGIFTCLFSQFGGTCCTAILLGQHASWTAGNHVTNAFLLAWWLTFCCPGDVWFMAMGYRALRLSLQSLACISAAHAVSSWGVEKALVADHVKMRNSAWGALAAGYLSGCFGWPLVAYFETGGDRLGKMGPSWAMQRTFYAVLFYYVCTNPHGTLTPYKSALGLGEPDKALVQSILAASFLTLQVGVDIVGVNLLQTANSVTSVLASVIVPVNMKLAHPKQD
mmetsp:Transcript_9824/g.19101  ORF Transcript_9824/g.19101 Transcript_9824/m.19101 type:complete len:359 (+) Transcript_9824:82-1158(+)